LAKVLGRTKKAPMAKTPGKDSVPDESEDESTGSEASDAEAKEVAEAKKKKKPVVIMLNLYQVRNQLLQNQEQKDKKNQINKKIKKK